MKKFAAMLLGLLLAVSLAACGDPASDPASAQSGDVYTLRLKINPTFTIGYDEAHMVTSLTADNQDAQDILDRHFQENPIGDNLDTVAQQLVIKAYTDGYAADHFQVALSFVGQEDTSDYRWGLESLIDEYVEEPYADATPYTAGDGSLHTDPVPLTETSAEASDAAQHELTERTCPDCGGSGQVACPECGGTHRCTCESCAGTGVTIAHGEDEEYADVTCDMCHGSGQREKIEHGDVVGMETCPNCGGKGTRYLSTGETIVHDDEIPCPQCEGRGWNPCPCCETGMLQCERCLGDGILVE